jgi:FtsH-binding integral membrane protein
MSGFEYAPQTARQAPSMALDAGLRSYMLGIYNKMSLGLALSAAIAWAVGSVPALSSMVFGTPLRYVVMFGPLALLLVAAFAMRRPSPLAANLLYWSVTTLIGAKAFFITAGAFGALSLWGYTTRRDLSAMGTVLVMGVVGLVLASIANLFFQSSLLGFIISLVGVAVFSALTAFDTQRLKQEYYVLEAGGREMAAATSLGALSLYLNFVNLFQFILSILSTRQE